MKKETTREKSLGLLQKPEELIYRSCYSPAPLSELLANAETRSKIRRLPPIQISFGTHELDDEEIQQLLPHITEDQWRTILDLDIWSRDRMRLEALLGWTRHLVNAEPAVARKILRATGDRLWTLAFSKGLKVFAKISEDEFDGDPGADEESFLTPDGAFLVVLPKYPDKARAFHQLLKDLYSVDPEATAYWLNSSRFQTRSELEEAAYQDRTQRLEEMGFQDYYEAVSIYTPLEVSAKLQRKDWGAPLETTLPIAARPGTGDDGMLLLKAMAIAEKLSHNATDLVQELFFVCNKLLVADRVSTRSKRNVKRGIRKAICGINLGLEYWSEGDLTRASEGVLHHHLISFFQMGFGRLLELRRVADRVLLEEQPPRGSFRETVIEGFRLKYPLSTYLLHGRPRRRFIDSPAGVEEAHRQLERRFDPHPAGQGSEE